jgi:hypothetical protein
MKDGFQIFDTHTHIGHGLHHGRRYSAEQLLAAMEKNGVDRSVVIPFPVVADTRATHDEIGRAVKAHPERLVGTVCIYPYIGPDKFRDEVKRCRGIWLSGAEIAAAVSAAGSAAADW